MTQDAEVPAASAQAPQEVGVLVGARLDELAAGRHYVRRHEVVASCPVLAREPAQPATERQPGDAGHRDVPGRRGQAKGLRLAVQPASNRPGSARARRPTGSTLISFSPERSMTSPSSQAALPATLWPPPRTASGRPCSRAKATAAITSATSPQRVISAGRLSIIPFQTCRAKSYRAACGRRSSPPKAPLSSDRGFVELHPFNSRSCSEA
jgi:hypothetical protein